MDNVLASGNVKAGRDVHFVWRAALRHFVEELKLDIQPDASEGPRALGEIICCSSRMNVVKKQGLGVSPLRWAILRAAGLDEALK